MLELTVISPGSVYQYWWLATRDYSGSHKLEYIMMVSPLGIAWFPHDTTLVDGLLMFCLSLLGRSSNPVIKHDNRDQSRIPDLVECPCLRGRSKPMFRPPCVKLLGKRGWSPAKSRLVLQAQALDLHSDGVVKLAKQKWWFNQPKRGLIVVSISLVGKSRFAVGFMVMKWL